MRWIRKIHASWPPLGEYCDARQRRVAPPAGLGRVEEQRRVEDDPAEQQQPERQRVEPRERHVARADHQRHEVVAEAGHHRHDEQEDHRRPVHREQLVVVLGGQQRVVRARRAAARISSASTPPSMKKTKVRTRYMIPIFLWSVVVTQSTHRLVSRGRVDLVRDDLRGPACGSGGGLGGDGHRGLSFLADFRWR